MYRVTHKKYSEIDNKCHLLGLMCWPVQKLDDTICESYRGIEYSIKIFDILGNSILLRYRKQKMELKIVIAVKIGQRVTKFLIWNLYQTCIDECKRI